MHRCILHSFAVAISVVTTLPAEPPLPDGIRLLTDMAYKQGDALTDYEKERCKLDVYLPKEGQGFATLVWFHGGGLKNGDKDGRKITNDSVKTAKIARSLAAAGIAVVAPNYRFSPKATFPAYIQDAAAAVAWVRKHIVGYGGDPARIFIGGHSAGGYFYSIILLLEISGS